MRIAIISSNIIELCRKNILDKYIPKRVSLVICDGKNYSEKLARRHVGKQKVVTEENNEQRIDKADLSIFIWDGIDEKVKHAIDYAKSKQTWIKLILIDVSGVEIMPGIDLFGNAPHSLCAYLFIQNNAFFLAVAVLQRRKKALFCIKNPSQTLMRFIPEQV